MYRLSVWLLLAGGLAEAQGPRIGVIEIYGLRKVKAEAVRKALGVAEGGPLPSSKVDTEERIEDVPGIVRASLTAICCDPEKRAILYVGVEEKGGPRFVFHTPPVLEIKVPAEVEKEWMNFITAVDLATKRGGVDEDLTKGHSLITDPGARQSQEKFIALADEHLAVLREVMRKSADEQQRAIAAFVLGYSSKKKAVADDLQYAMQDSDATVRNNAMRALSAIGVLAALHPELDIRISSTWFVEMLNSVHFTDRSKASIYLVDSTEKREESSLRNIRERAIPALLEMAQWRDLGHALPAFILLGRAAGLPEEQIQEMWKKGQRDVLLEKVRETVGRK
ncbi:MAG TPA: HEAT repeat domain-containing protein [Bryobacteraceae bacterium]|nr:HEAT repeat domain-containing protein [Bryobacteraceae bacterium]